MKKKTYLSRDFSCIIFTELKQNEKTSRRKFSPNLWKFVKGYVLMNYLPFLNNIHSDDILMPLIIITAHNQSWSH